MMAYHKHLQNRFVWIRINRSRRADISGQYEKQDAICTKFFKITKHAIHYLSLHVYVEKYKIKNLTNLYQIDDVSCPQREQGSKGTGTSSKGNLVFIFNALFVVKILKKMTKIQLRMDCCLISATSKELYKNIQLDSSIQQIKILFLRVVFHNASQSLMKCLVVKLVECSHVTSLSTELLINEETGVCDPTGNAVQSSHYFVPMLNPRANLTAQKR